MSAPGLYERTVEQQLALLPISAGRPPALSGLADALDRAAHKAATLTVRDARLFVAWHLARTEAVSPLSLERYRVLWSRFEKFAETAFRVRLVSGVDGPLVEAFLRARTTNGLPPRQATSHLRRSAVTLLFRVLRQFGLASTAPTLDLVLDARSYLSYRPLTDHELERCRWAALNTTIETRLPAVLALAEAGAWAVEIPEVRAGHLALEAGQVSLPGGPKAAARMVPLTGWGARQLARRLKWLEPGGPDRLVAYSGDGSDQSRRTSAAQALRDVLVRGGLGDTRGVERRSITAWAGVQAFAHGGIEAAALRLGLASLDAAAKVIGHQWQGPP